MPIVNEDHGKFYVNDTNKEISSHGKITGKILSWLGKAVKVNYIENGINKEKYLNVGSLFKNVYHLQEISKSEFNGLYDKVRVGIKSIDQNKQLNINDCLTELESVVHPILEKMYRIYKASANAFKSEQEGQEEDLSMRNRLPEHLRVSGPYRSIHISEIGETENLPLDHIKVNIKAAHTHPPLIFAIHRDTPIKEIKQAIQSRYGEERVRLVLAGKELFDEEGTLNNNKFSSNGILYVTFPSFGGEKKSEQKTNDQLEEEIRENERLLRKRLAEGMRVPGPYQSAHITEIGDSDPLQSGCFKATIKLDQYPDLIFAIRKEATIEEIKQAVQSRYGVIDPRLIFAGKQLEDGRTLDNYRFPTNGGNLYVRLH